MSVLLEIPDGSPNWWLSPNIWTVPGDDPEGAPGMPIAGESCFLWARVTNNGTDAVQNATVRFYWADPSVGFDRTTANHVGDANVSLAAGETQDVLCLVPWMPTFVNGGHECVLAEAFHPAQDPLPASPDFNVPTDRHVAQRNLSVVMMMKSMHMFSLPFRVCNTWRTERTFEIQVKPGELEELRELTAHNRHLSTKLAKGEAVQAGLSISARSDEDDLSRAKAKVERFVVKPGTCRGLNLVGRLEGEAALLHVVQTVDGQEVGGLSVLVVRGNEEQEVK